MKFNDEHIPDSPFRVPVLPSSGDARKVTVQALKQKGLEVGNFMRSHMREFTSLYKVKGEGFTGLF